MLNFVKWTIAFLAGFFSAGTAQLMAKEGLPLDARFWFIAIGGGVISISGMGANKGIDASAKRRR